MKKALIIALVLLISLFAGRAIYAGTSNSVLNISGGNTGYSISIVSDPEMIPIFVIQPNDTTILDGISFELRLSKARWDIEAFKDNPISDYGSVNSDGVFKPAIGTGGYLTSERNPVGVSYTLKAGDRDNIAIVTMEPGDPADRKSALYIPILAEITGSNPSIEIYSDFVSDISFEGNYFFTIPGINGVTTQLRAGDIKRFSQAVTLSDITVREMTAQAITGGTLTISAPTGYRWIDIDKIKITGVASGDSLSVASIAYETGRANQPANQAVIKAEVRRSGSPQDPGKLTISNLRIAALPDNRGAGPVSVTVSGCNIKQETVKVAEKQREDYTFTTAGAAPAKLAAGSDPADPMAASARTIKVTMEEVSPGLWRSQSVTNFTLPEGITARAVLVNTTNLSADLAADTAIRRIDENAFRLNAGDSGTWTLSSRGLAVEGAKTKPGQRAKLELTFFISVSDSFSGPVNLTTGGAALSHSESVVIAEVSDKAPVPSVVLTIGSRQMRIGSNTFEMDVAPFIEDGFTLVPVSFVASALGLPPGSVVWEESDRTVTIKTGANVSVLTIDSVYLKIDGVNITIPKAPLIRDGRTFLPFRVLGEQILKVKVGWDDLSRTASFY